MFGWGYCMPEAIADALVKHGGLGVQDSVLDLGCGNGLCGQALHNRGLEDLNGIDFSRYSSVHNNDSKVLHKTEVTLFLTACRSLKTYCFDEKFKDIIALFIVLLLTPSRQKLVHYVHQKRNELWSYFVQKIDFRRNFKDKL